MSRNVLLDDATATLRQHGLDAEVEQGPHFKIRFVNARADIEHILSSNDFGPNPTIEDLRDALTWLEHAGKHCDYHTEMLSKED